MRPESFDALVQAALAADLRDPGDPRWGDFLAQRLSGERDCEAFVEWARQHRKWQFNVADVADRICAKPREAAITILADIVTELAEELDEELDDDPIQP